MFNFQTVKINGNYVLSAGDLVCVYSRSLKKWTRSAWNSAMIIDAEWISEKQGIFGKTEQLRIRRKF